jgi:D-alanyl-D-alanine carboxypeptidase
VTQSQTVRPPARRIRIRRTRAAGLLVAIAAIAALSREWTAASSSTAVSSSTAASSIHALRSERLGVPGAPHGGARAARLGAPGEVGAAPPIGRGDALGEADGAVPDGTTVFDDGVPGVARLAPALLVALRGAATDAAGDGVAFSVDSGWRSRGYQEQLLQAAIAKYGSQAQATRWVATPDTSAHVLGDAVDLGPSDATEWLSEHGAAYGLCQIYANEPWHYELRPEAIAGGCPAMYADPTQDPRMQR